MVGIKILLIQSLGVLVFLLNESRKVFSAQSLTPSTKLWTPLGYRGFWSLGCTLEEKPLLSKDWCRAKFAVCRDSVARRTFGTKKYLSRRLSRTKLSRLFARGDELLSAEDEASPWRWIVRMLQSKILLCFLENLLLIKLSASSKSWGRQKRIRPL